MNHTETGQILITVIISFLSYCFGVVTPALEFLIWCVVLDIFTGTLASFVNPKMLFNSRKMFRGLVKKVVLFSIVAFSKHLDILMHTDIICMTTTYFFIVNEGLSVLENAGKCGIKLPNIIRDNLEQLKELNKK